MYTQLEHTHTHPHSLTSIHRHMYAAHTCTHTLTSTHIHTHNHLQAHIDTCVHTNMHMYTHTLTSTHIHTHTQRHTYTSVYSWSCDNVCQITKYAFKSDFLLSVIQVNITVYNHKQLIVVCIIDYTIVTWSVVFDDLLWHHLWMTSIKTTGYSNVIVINHMDYIL